MTHHKDNILFHFADLPIVGRRITRLPGKDNHMYTLTLIKSHLKSSALLALVIAPMHNAFSQSEDANMFNSPTFRGNTTVISVEGAVEAGFLRGLKANAGGGDVMLGTIARAKGAKTEKLTNAPKMDGVQQIYSTGPVTAQSIRVDEGATTKEIQNATWRKGDLEIYAGGVAGTLSMFNRSLETFGTVTADSVHVCAGAKAGNILNNGQTTGNTRVIGGTVSVNSVVVGC